MSFDQLSEKYSHARDFIYAIKDRLPPSDRLLTSDGSSRFVDISDIDNINIQTHNNSAEKAHYLVISNQVIAITDKTRKIFAKIADTRGKIEFADLGVWDSPKETKGINLFNPQSGYIHHITFKDEYNEATEDLFEPKRNCPLLAPVLIGITLLALAIIGRATLSNLATQIALR